MNLIATFHNVPSAVIRDSISRTDRSTTDGDCGVRIHEYRTDRTGDHIAITGEAQQIMFVMGEIAAHGENGLTGVRPIESN